MIPKPSHSIAARQPSLTNLACRFLLLYFAALPLWWVLGLEQLLPSAFAVLILLPIVRQGRFPISPNTLLRIGGLLFLLGIAVSATGLFDAPPKRYISYFRDTTSHALFVLLLFLVSDKRLSWKSLWRLQRTAILALTGGALIAITANLANWAVEFQSVAGSLLPRMLSDSAFGEAIFVKTLYKADAWWMGSAAERLTGFFLFPNSAALAVELVFPITVFLGYWSVKQKRSIAFFWIGCSIILGYFLLFTYSRAGLVALLAATVVLFGLRLSKFVFMHRLALPVFWTSLAALPIVFLIVIQQNMWGSGDRLMALSDAAVSARGTGSAESRVEVYRRSLEAIASRPTGYGTLRDADSDIEQPLGSHSGYLGILFRYGVVGFLGFAIIFLGLIRIALSAWTIASQSKSNYSIGLTSAYAIALLALLFHQLLVELSLDAVTLCVVVVVLMNLVGLRYLEDSPLSPILHAADDSRSDSVGTVSHRAVT